MIFPHESMGESMGFSREPSNDSEVSPMKRFSAYATAVLSIALLATGGCHNKDDHDMQPGSSTPASSATAPATTPPSPNQSSPAPTNPSQTPPAGAASTPAPASNASSPAPATTTTH